MTVDYRVRLEAFQGPLDLLLFLIRRAEVDVTDIPISTIADQYLEHLAAIERIDIDLAGEFLVMAATLMEIKSRSLLPQEAAAEGDDEPDPRRELVKQLLEYRKFKDAAAALEECAEKQTTRMARIAPDEPQPPGATPVRPVELWDLVGA
ncbi:MAG: segregation and condensation protein A, partial [Phycisphaerales bacterium]